MTAGVTALSPAAMAAAQAPAAAADGGPLSALERVEQRVVAAEQLVGKGFLDDLNAPAAAAADGKPAASPLAASPAALLEQLREMTARVQAIDTEQQSNVKAFFDKYEAAERFLNAASVKDLILSTEKRARVVLLAEEDFKQVASMLEAVEQHRVVLESEPIKHLPSVQAQVAKCEQLTRRELLESAAVNDEVQQLLDTYNDLIEALSRKVLYWHERLAALERRK